MCALMQPHPDTVAHRERVQALMGEMIWLLDARAAEHDISKTQSPEVEAFNAVTGWDFTPQEAAAVGFRLSNVFRAFNLRNGIGPELEKFSPRWGSAPVDGPCVGVSVAPQWDSMLDNYYKLMGWDRKTGKPTQATLKKYGLEYLIKDLYP